MRRKRHTALRAARRVHARSALFLFLRPALVFAPEVARPHREPIAHRVARAGSLSSAHEARRLLCLDRRARGLRGDDQDRHRRHSAGHEAGHGEEASHSQDRQANPAIPRRAPARWGSQSTRIPRARSLRASSRPIQRPHTKKTASCISEWKARRLVEPTQSTVLTAARNGLPATLAMRRSRSALMP